MAKKKKISVKNENEKSKREESSISNNNSQNENDSRTCSASQSESSICSMSKMEGQKENNKKQRQRHENSLGELTKNFIRYIKENGDNVVPINDVVKKLKVKKRRIYDITNVLEGKFLNKKRNWIYCKK